MTELELTEIENILFPHAEIREAQDELIRKINDVIINKKNLVVHAPTGLGKTAASLSPAISNIVQKPELTIYFLTSRHTQHKIVIDTLRKINQKFKKNIIGSSIIGKKHLCLQPSVDSLPSKEFAEFCRLLTDNDKCDFYRNVKSGTKLTPETEIVLRDLKTMDYGVTSTENIFTKSMERNICPYEAALLMAKDARVIVSDYSYIFNPRIREGFLKKTNKELRNAIIIVDEAHNLPNRVKDLVSEYLSNITVKRAINEAKKNGFPDIVLVLEDIDKILESMAKPLISEQENKYSRNTPEKEAVTLQNFTSAGDVGKRNFAEFNANEKYITREEFTESIERIKNYDELISELVFIANAVREKQHLSYIGSIATFLETWTGTDEGFTRIVSVKKLKDKTDMITLSYRCLDPSLITAPVINAAYSTILMSGTLTPTSMYKELFGIDAEELTLKSPFPQENRMNLIIPKTSTKYEARSQDQYKEIANVLQGVAETIDGCIAVYYPSYYLMDEISKYLNTKISKAIFTEVPGMTKTEKQEFLKNFESYKDKGALLNAVITGSFAEGIDLPGILKGIVIVGLPLQKPDLETKALIDYYDKKFKKGWDYGYLFPAFTKAIQAAGRCIRSETDRGIIIFLDERYTWSNYYRCFPPTWKIRISLLYRDLIKDFYK